MDVSRCKKSGMDLIEEMVELTVLPKEVVKPRTSPIFVSLLPSCGHVFSAAGK